MRALALALALPLAACALILPDDAEEGDDGSAPAEDLFVAVGDAGAVVTSPDGVTWTIRPTGVGVNLHDVAFESDTFVAVGATGKILTSVNGLDWTAASSPSSRDLHAVTWHVDRFYAVGGDHSAGAETLTSLDGTTWTRPELAAPLHVLTDVASNGYALVAIGLYQPDARNFGLFVWDAAAGWQQQIDGTTTGARYDAVAPGIPAFTLIGAGTSASSADGLTWTSQPIFSVPPMHALTYTGLGWIAVGDGGGALTSLDARTWSGHTTPSSATLRGVTSDGALLIAVGDGGAILGSGDGATWTAAASPLEINLQAVTHPRGG